MAKTQEILAEIKNGISPEDLARKVAWKEIDSSDANELLDIALRLPDNQHSYNLLVFLFRASFGKDLWFSTEVLGQAVQHPNMTLLDRQAILPTMRSRLDQIKDQISIKSPPEEKLIKYWLMEATYYSVNGGMLAVNGQRTEAAQNYQIAQGIFEQLGQFQQAAKYKTLYKRLMSKDASNAPLPKTAPIRFELPPTRPFSRRLTEGEEAESTEQEDEFDEAEEAPAENYDAEFISKSTMVTARLIPKDLPVSPAEEIDGEEATVEEEEEGSPADALLADRAPDEGSQIEDQVGVEEEPESKIPDSSNVSEMVTAILEAPPQDEVQVILGPEDLDENQPAEQETDRSESIDEQLAETGELVIEQDSETSEPPVQPVLKPITKPLSEESVFEPMVQEAAGTVAGVYYPLPDVWLEEGKLHILGFNSLESDEARRQMEQIRQQAEILIGIQLQIQIYLKRRAFLEHDMKLMENRARQIAARLEALQAQEKDLTQQE